MASREGRGSDMPVHVKLPPCFRSSKQPKTELIWEPTLARGLLWKNTHFIERSASSEIVLGQTGKPLCQELTINLASPGGKLEYTSTEQGRLPPLTLVACCPSWDDYFDLSETVTEMANCLMEEDRQQVQTPPKAATTPKQKDVAQVTVLPPNDNVTLILAAAFPGAQPAGSSRENPVHLSDATEASVSGSHPMKEAEMEDEAATLGHFSDTLHEMAASIMHLVDGYFIALHEVIIETEKALHDLSRIDAHYISHMVTVMTSWQEAVQTTASHVEGVNTTTYLAHQEDAQKAMKEYVAAVVQAHQEHDAAHKEEQKRWKEAIKANDFEDPVVCLLHVTRKVAHAQAEKAVGMLLASIESTLRKHIPVNAQGPLIVNALSTAFQFQMSVWCMIGKECIRPMWAKHSDWCGLAGIIQAIVETFPQNCALMFPPTPAPLHHLPALSDQPHLRRTMTTMTMTRWVPTRVFTDLGPAYPCPLIVGAGALAGLVIPLPSHRPLCPMGVPLFWCLTQRRCSVVHLVCPQTMRKITAGGLLMRSWTWGLRLMMRPKVKRNQLKMLGTNP